MENAVDQPCDFEALRGERNEISTRGGRPKFDARDRKWQRAQARAYEDYCAAASQVRALRPMRSGSKAQVSSSGAITRTTANGMRSCDRSTTAGTGTPAL